MINEKGQVWRLSHRSTSGAQLTLQPNETHRLQPLPPGIRILAGLAWISWNGKDHLLGQGEAIQFQAGKDAPVISPVGHDKLIVEMLPSPT